MDVSISIVSYNTRDLLKRCLASVYKYTKNIKYEIIVVDNASSDGTVEMVKDNFPKVKIVANKTNVFYTTANNQALKKTSGRYILILNSDTYFVDNSVKKMMDYMDRHENVGAAEGMEIYEDGKVVPTGSRKSTPLIDFYELSLVGKRIQDKKLIKYYRIGSKSRRNNFEVDVACDAFIIVRGNLLKKIKGYNPALKLYYTENDICRRIKGEGYKIMHLGDVKVMHSVSVSANKLKWKKLDLYYLDLLNFYSISGKKPQGIILFILLKLEEYILMFVRPGMFEKD